MAEELIKEINRSNSQYKGVDTTLLSDDALKTSQSGGIGVGAKLKALNVADPENGVEAYVVDAFDIDWKGYKIGNTPVTSTGQVLEYLNTSYFTATTDVNIWEEYSPSTVKEGVVPQNEEIKI